MGSYIRVCGIKPVSYNLNLYAKKIVDNTQYVPINELERIKNDTDWRSMSNYKEFYTAITDALRQYMNERFGINATEMTSDEILDSLKKHVDKDAIRELQEILSTADLVKFAKYNPPMNENDRSLMGIIEFVESTKSDTGEEAQKPTELRVVNKRSAREKHLLLAGIALLSAMSIVLLVLLIMDLYNIFI